MGKNLEYKVEGRFFDVQLVKSFLTKNGYEVKREELSANPFFACAYFNKEAFNILHQQEWFLRTDLDVYKLQSK